MVACSAYGCKSRTERKEKEITFHRFPLKKPEKNCLWVKNMKLANFVATKNHRLCSRHFEAHCFYRVGQKTQLLDQAVPTIFLELPKHLQQSRIIPKTENHSIMEELERNLFQSGTTLGHGCLSASISLSPPEHDDTEVVLKKDQLDEKEDPKLLEIGILNHHNKPKCFTMIILDYTELEMHQICRGCLSISDISDMQYTFIGGVRSTELYENISHIKVQGENVPTSMCKTCIVELGKTDKFIKTLNHSYNVLARAAEEIENLNKHRNIDSEKNSVQRINILRYVLKEKHSQTNVEDIRITENETENEKCEIDDDSSSDDFSEHFRSCDDSGSSEDEIPLSERFKINTNKRNEDNRTIKSTKRSNVQDNVTLPKKRFKKRTDNLENLPNNAALNPDKEQLESQTKNRLNAPDTCPVCSKNIRFLVKHLQSVHSLDWEDSRCSKCTFKNVDKHKLVEHCRECEFKSDYPDYFETEELKVEWSEEIDEQDEGDADFEMFEPDRSRMKELDVEEKEVDEFTNDLANRKKVRYKKFNCNKCEGAQFRQYAEIEAHLKSFHATESKCILCEQEFNNSFSLLYHMMVKHGKLKCCRLCLVSFRGSEELNAHYKSEEHNTKCTVCGEQFKNRKALYEHRRKKHLNPQLENKKYKCPECPKEFANQNNIRRHIMVSHNDLRFLCDTCGQSYTTKRNLKLHIQKFHEGVQVVQNKNTKKSFFCEACGRELKIFHKYAIAMHRAKHKGHNFVCKKCYDSFATEQEFKQHVEEFSHQLYECDKCQAEFVREENFKVHLKNHDAPGWNKNMFATWGKSAKLRNEKGEFVCSYCPKVFKDKQRLDNHVRVHTNERPYKCHICSKGFKTWIHRKTHINIHLGIKKWVCKYCSKAFTNSCTLKGHEMIHTGERPHRCPECKKGFITMSAMKKHCLVHFKTGNPNYWKKHQINMKDEDKTESEHEENDDFIYKYGQMFTGSDVSYESFTEPPKEPPVGMDTTDKELSC